MLAWLLFIVLSSRHLPEHLRAAWDYRYVLLLNIAPGTKPLPWSMVDAERPPVKLQPRWLPVEYYDDADRERNRRLYGVNSVRLNPTMLVMHFTVTQDPEAIIAGFSSPAHLPVGNQTPIVSLVTVHYMVGQDATIYQLVPEHRTTTGTYGVDHLALAIEMVAKDEKDLMSRPMQLLTAFYLADSLMRKYNIPVTRVFSHQEVALGKFFLDEYTDLADTVSPYFYPKPDFRYDPGPTVMAWCREFLLRRRKLWDKHPASKRRRR